MLMNRPVITERTTINDLDPYIKDRKKYANLYWKLYGTRLTESAYQATYRFLTEPRPPRVTLVIHHGTFRALSDLFKEIHPEKFMNTSMCGYIDWARDTDLIREAEYIQMKEKWQSVC